MRSPTFAILLTIMKRHLSFEAMETQPNKQKKLAEQFLNGEVSPEVFLSTLMELDQLEPTRAEALENIRVMEDPQVTDRFVGSDHQAEFYDHLGFFYFHRGQTLEAEGIGGLPEFKKALTYSQLGGADDDHTADWLRYVGTTIAYLKNDIVTVRSLYNENDGNAALVRNFIQGLETRGEPNYVEDYRAPR